MLMEGARREGELKSQWRGWPVEVGWRGPQSLGPLYWQEGELGLGVGSLFVVVVFPHPSESGPHPSESGPHNGNKQESS